METNKEKTLPMSKYTKIPVTIDAISCKNKTLSDVVTWAKTVNPQVNTTTFEPTINGIAIQTLKGTMVARPNDYILCGVHGEFYPCREDIFHETYTEVDAEKPAEPQAIYMVDGNDGNAYSKGRRRADMIISIGIIAGALVLALAAFGLAITAVMAWG